MIDIKLCNKPVNKNRLALSAAAKKEHAIIRFTATRPSRVVTSMSGPVATNGRANSIIQVLR